jgi:hypothetical protein
VGLVVCLLIVAVWVTSTMVSVWARKVAAGRAIVTGAMCGDMIRITYAAPAQQARVRFVRVPPSDPWYGKLIPGLPRVSPGFVVIPLWTLFVPLAIPTAILWRLDRRPPLGHCHKCAYDLTGNVTGVCPECGVAI